MELNNYCVIMNLYCGLTGGLYCHAFVHAYNCIINLHVQHNFIYVQLTFCCFCRKIVCVMEIFFKPTFVPFLFWNVSFYFHIKHCCAFMFIQSQL